MTVYMPPEMKEKYQQSNAVGLKERVKLVNGEFSITPFYVPHNGTPNYAYLVNCGEHRIAWLTDLEYCPYILKNQNLTEIFCECNYQKSLVDRELPQYVHKLRGHMSLDSCKSFIDANKTSALRTVILCHMGAETTIAEECLSEVQKVVGKGVSVLVAHKGLEVELKESGCPF